MTILNALDLTLQDRPQSASKASAESDFHRPGEVTLDTANIDLKDRSEAVEDSGNTYSMQMNPAGEGVSEEALWIKASGMMGDLEGLGLRLKAEVESAVKAIASRQSSDGETIGALSRSVEDYQTEIRSLRLSISALRASAEETQIDFNSQLAKQAEEKNKIIEDLQNRFASLDSEVQDLKSENAELKLELETTKESLSLKPHAIVNTEEINRLNLELSQKSALLEEQSLLSTTLNSKNEELATKIQALEDERANLSSTLLDKDSDISDLQEKLQASEDTYLGQVALFEKQQDELKAALEQESQDKEHYMQQLETLIAQHEAVQEKYKTAKKDMKQLELALDTAKKAVGVGISQAQLKYYQELEKKYVQAKK